MAGGLLALHPFPEMHTDWQTPVICHDNTINASTHLTQTDREEKITALYGNLKKKPSVTEGCPGIQNNT